MAISLPVYAANGNVIAQSDMLQAGMLEVAQAATGGGYNIIGYTWGYSPWFGPNGDGQQLTVGDEVLILIPATGSDAVAVAGPDDAPLAPIITSTVSSGGSTSPVASGATAAAGGGSMIWYAVLGFAAIMILTPPKKHGRSKRSTRSRRRR